MSSGATALEIGPLEVDPPVVLAPMAGVTNAAYRTLCRQFGGGLYVSEMINARAVCEANAKTMRMLRFGVDESPRSIQLYAVDPVDVAGAVSRLVDEMGVDHIDLNFGCPVPKVTRHGGGAALPAHGVLFRHIVAAAVAAAGSVPVTVKMRIGVDGDTVTSVEAGRSAEGEGAAAVTLHARTAEQRYSGEADWRAIAALKAAVTTVPVLGNGDIWDAADALRMVAETGCDGVVVGRGCLGRPWIFGQLDAAFTGRPVPDEPDVAEVARVMGRHVDLLTELQGETHAVVQFRRHASWYLSGYPVGGVLRRAVVRCSTRGELDDVLGRLAATGVTRVDGPTVHRGPSDGPRPVALPHRWLDTRDDPTPPSGARLLVSGG